jgi:uncharacterized membrane protein YjfL (UPF0719 family)
MKRYFMYFSFGVLCVASFAGAINVAASHPEWQENYNNNTVDYIDDLSP